MIPVVRCLAAAVLLLLWCGEAVPAQKVLSTPKPGSAERAAIMDCLRAPVQKELKRKAVFEIKHLKVQNGWAFLTGVPRQPDGAAMEYRGTPYADARRAGAFDDWICALLHRQSGKWRVVTYVIGATDVAWWGWDRKYKAPAAIFPRIHD